MAHSDAKTAQRAALVDAAARLIASEGPDAPTLRRVADEVGTSTMAIYTHFGGMQELRRAVRIEGFVRLGERLEAVDHTDDPVADLSVVGIAYFVYATGNPDLYHVMFMEKMDDADAAVGWKTFESLVAAVERCLASGRFTSDTAEHLARQLWAQAHGVVTLHLAQRMSFNEALGCFGAAVLNLFMGFGDDRDAAVRSLAEAAKRAGAIRSS